VTDAQKLASGRKVSIAEGFIQTIGIGMGGIYVPNFVLTAFLLEVMHASHALIGVATASQFFVGLLQPIANLFVHRTKHRRVLAAITGLAGRLLFILAIFYGMINSGPGAEVVFIIVLLLGAFSMSFSSSTWATWMADLVPENIRGRYFAARNSVSQVAGIIAVLIGGWLLKGFPGHPGFIAVYTVGIITACVGFVLVMIQYEPPAPEHAPGSVLSSYKEILKDRNFMAFVRMVMFFNLAIVVASPFFAVHFIEVLQVPIDVLAYFTAGAAVTGILGNLFFGKLSEILGNRFIIRFSLLLLMIPTGLMLFIPQDNALPWVAAVILTQTFFMAGWNLAIFNTSLSISPRNKRALYIGMYNSMNSLSAVLAPVLGGFLIDLYKTHHVPVPVVGLVFPPTVVVFALSLVLLLIGLLVFPFYQEGNRHEDYSLRDVVFRTNFPEILYKLFMSTFLPRITSRHRLTEDIADLRSPAAAIPLERLLGDLDPEVRLSALDGLGKTGSGDALKALLDYHPRAGVLEGLEVLKAFKGFAEDSRVQAVLLEEARSPYLQRRLRAIRSLEPAAKATDVSALAIAQLRSCLVPQGDPMDEEEYLGWVELGVQGREWAALELSLPRYGVLSPPGRRVLLYLWSHLLGVRDEFYRYLSYDTADDRASVVDEARAAAVTALSRNRHVGEDRHALRRQAKSHPETAFLRSHEKALFHALQPWNASVQSLIAFFLHHQETEDEEVFLLFAVQKLVE
jgi:MFS family permease